MEEAVFLTRFAKQVTVIHRRNSLRATPVLADRALTNKTIRFKWDSAVTAIIANTSGVTGIRIKNLKTNEESEMNCDGVFIAIGHQPNTSLFVDQLEMDNDGYLRTKNGTETNVPGVFAAGDVQDQQFRQAVTAAGTGCMAAIQAERFLDDLPYDPNLSCQKGICKTKS
jgi:thioredoxin reductase (NADPH)